MGRMGKKLGLLFLLAFGCVCIAGELLGKWKLPGWQENGSFFTGEQAVEVTADGSYIKWVEFHAPCEALAASYDLDVETYLDENHISWI